MRNNDYECPYCDTAIEKWCEDYEPNVLHQTECSHCEKTFIVEIEYSPSYSVRKADCLNGEEHDWRDHLAKDEYMRKYYSVNRTCQVCGREERIPVVKKKEPQQ